MPGTWLARVGARWLHRETFALVVSPAIADLQFEAPAGFAHRVRHYLAVWKAFTAALCVDAAGDVHSLCDEIPTMVSLMLMQTSYYTFMLILLTGFGSGRFSAAAARAHGVTVTVTLLCAAMIGIVCLIPTITCFWTSRRETDAGAR